MTVLNTYTDRERATRRAIVERAQLTRGEALLVAEVLERIAAINLDDMICAPGFDDMGNANPHTPEWRLWANIDDLIQQARRVGEALHHALDDQS